MAIRKISTGTNACFMSSLCCIYKFTSCNFSDPVSRSDEFSQSETKRARGTSVLQWARDFMQENPHLHGPDDPLQLWKPQMQSLQPPLQGLQPQLQALLDFVTI